MMTLEERFQTAIATLVDLNLTERQIQSMRAMFFVGAAALASALDELIRRVELAADIIERGIQ